MSLPKSLSASPTIIFYIILCCTTPPSCTASKQTPRNGTQDTTTRRVTASASRNNRTMPLSPKDELQNLVALLTLFHHRNKNQHRLAKWYKSLTILHRQTPELLSCLTNYYSALELSAKSRYTVEAREKLVERVDFLGKWVLGKCYL